MSIELEAVDTGIDIEIVTGGAGIEAVQGLIDNRVPSPAGEDDERILKVSSGALVYGDQTGGGGSGLPSGGTTGQILAKASDTDGDYGFVSPNAANGWLRLDGDGTAPDNRIPSTIARDTEVTSAVNALASTLAPVATSGDYDDLTDKPTLGTAAAAATTDFATAAQGSTADSAVQPGDLAAVATTGAYGDLTGTPSLATVATTGAYSDLSGKPTLATVATTGAYSDLSGKPTLGTAAATDATAYATSAQGALADTAVQPAAILGAWRVLDHRALGTDTNNLDFTVTGYDEIEIAWSARCVNTAGSQVPLMVRCNLDTGSNYNVVRSGRVVNTNLLSNSVGATAGELGYVAASQTNTNRWSTGRITARIDQPAASRKMLTGESSYGQSTDNNAGTAQFGTEWTNTSDAITAIRLYASSDFVAGSRFTLLGRKFA